MESSRIYSPVFLHDDIPERIVAAARARCDLPEFPVHPAGLPGRSWQTAANLLAMYKDFSHRELIDIGADAALSGLSPIGGVIIPALELQSYVEYMNAWMHACSACPAVVVQLRDPNSANIQIPGREHSKDVPAATESCLQMGYVCGLLRLRIPRAELQIDCSLPGPVPSCTVIWKQQGRWRQLASRVLMFLHLRAAFIEMTASLMTCTPPATAAVPAGDAKPLLLPAFDKLSAREQEVAGLLISGKSKSEIADCLHVALPTVKRHTEKIYSKLGVHSRFELLNRVGLASQ